MPGRTFNTDDPIAYFLTWTAYGTWLPGDQRGWWRKDSSVFQQSNVMFHQMAATAMKETAFALSPRDRILVEESISRHCDVRNGAMHAVNARSNHVHVVVTASGYGSKTVRNQLKAWCTRYLKPLHPGRMRFWTEGGSCRSINQADDLEAAVVYVKEAQDRGGTDM